MKLVNIRSRKYGEEIRVCLLEMSMEYDETKIFHCLSPEEYKEYKKLQASKRKKEYFLGRLAAKTAVLGEGSDYQSLTIFNGIFREPLLKAEYPTKKRISISHNSEFAAAACFNENFFCGIDIERTESRNRNIIESVLTKTEKVKLLEHSNYDELYILFWTAKEALSKIIKTGIMIEPKLLEISELSEHSGIYWGIYKYFPQYEFWGTEIGTSICTIAVPRNGGYEIFKRDDLGNGRKYRMDRTAHLEIITLKMQRREIINYTYLLIDNQKAEVLIIDPSWELNKIKEIIERRDLTVASVLLTHYHYDHINLVDDIIDHYDCSIYIGLEEINYYNFKCKNMEPLIDREKLPFGNTSILCLETPGHTRGSMSFLVNNAFFTGDTLFIEGCGACDAKGSDPQSMYYSLQKIKTYVNDDTAIYPGHSFHLPVGQTYRTVYENNIYLQLMEKEKFVDFLMRKTFRQGVFK